MSYLGLRSGSRYLFGAMRHWTATEMTRKQTDSGATTGYEADAWRTGVEGDGYADVPGFCKSVALDEVRRHGHVLTPSRYFGVSCRKTTTSHSRAR